MLIFSKSFTVTAKLKPWLLFCSSRRADARHARAAQHEQCAVNAHEHIDRRIADAGKCVSGVAIDRIEPPDEPAPEVGKEVVAAVRRWIRSGRRVKRAACNGKAGKKSPRPGAGRRRIAVPVGKQRRIDACADIVWAFGARPSKVCASPGHIDFFPGIGASVIDIKAPRRGVYREAERVAQAVRPHGARQSLLVGEKGVVLRNAAVAVQAQQLAQRAAQVLGFAWIGVLANSDVELAIGAEVQGAAVVVGRCGQGWEIDQYRLAQRHCLIALCGEAADAVVGCAGCARRHRVVHKDKGRCRKIEVQRDSNQAAFARRVNRQLHERLRLQLTGPEHAHRAALLGDEQAPVGRLRQRRGPAQARDETLVFREPGGHRGTAAKFHRRCRPG